MTKQNFTDRFIIAYLAAREASRDAGSPGTEVSVAMDEAERYWAAHQREVEHRALMAEARAKRDEGKGK